MGPERMITVPPRHFCIIENPVMRNADGAVLFDVAGQARLLHADLEMRLARDPFPLYPGEVLKKGVAPLKIVSANTALRLRAVFDFEDENNEKRTAGDQWLFEGPGGCLRDQWLFEGPGGCCHWEKLSACICLTSLPPQRWEGWLGGS